jgi:hypothetical protein
LASLAGRISIVFEGPHGQDPAKQLLTACVKTVNLEWKLEKHDYPITCALLYEIQRASFRRTILDLPKDEQTFRLHWNLKETKWKAQISIPA